MPPSFSFAGIVYGVTVSLADVIAASQAFTSMKPALVGIGIIQARRSSDKLCSHVPSRVPAEVWLMIEAELRFTSITEARLDLMDELHCSECAKYAVDEVSAELTEGCEDDWNLAELDVDIRSNLRRHRRWFHLDHVHSDCWIDHPDPVEDAFCEDHDEREAIWRYAADDQVFHGVSSIVKLSLG